MNDKMNELTQFSPLAGELVLETVPGKDLKQTEYENEVNVVDGQDRSMYVYAPKSGCPDPKQGQVLMVLRSENTEESANELVQLYQLDKLAE